MRLILYCERGEWHSKPNRNEERYDEVMFLKGDPWRFGDNDCCQFLRKVIRAAELK